jgi:hypothetical protein
MYKIPDQLLEAVLNYLGTHKLNGVSWQEINNIINQLTKLERIEDKKDGGTTNDK